MSDDKIIEAIVRGEYNEFVDRLEDVDVLGYRIWEILIEQDRERMFAYLMSVSLVDIPTLSLMAKDIIRYDNDVFMSIVIDKMKITIGEYVMSNRSFCDILIHLFSTTLTADEKDRYRYMLNYMLRDLLRYCNLWSSVQCMHVVTRHMY